MAMDTDADGDDDQHPWTAIGYLSWAICRDALDGHSWGTVGFVLQYLEYTGGDYRW